GSVPRDQALERAGVLIPYEFVEQLPVRGTNSQHDHPRRPSRGRSTRASSVGRSTDILHPRGDSGSPFSRKSGRPGGSPLPGEIDLHGGAGEAKVKSGSVSTSVPSS